MEKIIYVQLLNEGTVVFRPVSSVEIAPKIFKVGGNDIHNSQNEKWEFLPDTIVEVEEKKLEERNVLVAVRQIDSNT